MNHIELKIMRNRNGCRIDVTYPINQHLSASEISEIESNHGQALEFTATEQYQEGGDIRGFELEFSDHDDAPTITFRTN